MPLEILQHPHPILREICAPVEAFDTALSDLAEAMFEAMYAAPGRGLAAPQIGVPSRLFVMDTAWKEGTPEPRVFVNPELTWTSDDHVVGAEGCLSLEGIPCKVERPSVVALRWQDLAGEWHQERFSGFAARCVQHERDHLDGILCIDYEAA